MRSSRYLALILLVLGSIWASLAGAMPIPNWLPSFERLGSEDGLSHNCVLAILQDRDGYLWLGTLDGLDRYDGVEIKVLRHHSNNNNSLSHNIVRALHEDRMGRLWVGTDAGVDRLDETRSHAIRYPLATPGEDEPRVHTIFESRAGILWLGTSQGLYRYDADSGDFKLWAAASQAAERTLPYADVLRLQEDGAALWLLVGDAKGDPSRASLVRLEAASGEVDSFALDGKGRPIYTFLIDRQGKLWLDAEVELPPELFGGRFEAAGGLSGMPVWALFEDREGDIWVGSEAGLDRINSSDDRRENEDVEVGWLGSFVLAIHQDLEGALWVGTLGGLFHSGAAAKPFVHLRHDPRDSASLSTDAVSALAEDAAGNIWAGTFGGGLNRIDAGLRQVERLRRDGTQGDQGDQGPCDDLIWALLLDARSGSEQLWLGTESGLCRLDLASRRFASFSLPILSGRGLLSRVTRIAKAEGEALWLATFRGLVHFDPLSGEGRLYAPTGDDRGPSDRRISALLRTQSALWLGTIAGTFDRFDPATGKFTHHRLRGARGEVIRTEGIFDLHEDAGGRLWLASGAGLNRFDPAGASRHFSVQDGLPGSVIYSIAAGADGRLWLGTNQGLARFRAADLGTAEVLGFSLGDGVGSHEFNRGAALAGSQGWLFFGGVGGVSAFDPRRVGTNPFVPPVWITRIRSAGRDGTLELPARALNRLILPPSHATVSFEFAAISFTHAAANRYAYRLDPPDREWIDGGHQRFARYTNLPPGEYVFRVRGANNDGLWNPREAMLPLTVQPTIWQALWFRGALAASLLALAIALYRYRVHSLLAVERLRVRIAGDLHDDLSSELSAVALVADFMAGQQHLVERDRSRLQEIRQRTVMMVDSLRDIVWYVNPEHDTLDATVRRARSLAQSLLPNADIHFVVRVPEKRSIGMRARRDLYLILKEAIHNVARHAAADRVEVLLELSSRSLYLRIRDDGRGFDPRQSAEGDGLRSLAARARHLGGELKIESAAGTGTTLELRVELASGWRDLGMGSLGSAL